LISYLASLFVVGFLGIRMGFQLTVSTGNQQFGDRSFSLTTTVGNCLNILHTFYCSKIQINS